MKKIILSLVTVLTLGWAVGQQQEQFSMYMMNNFMVNPAEAGTEEFIDIKIGYRTQWVSLSGAPKTFFLSGHAPLAKKMSRFDDVQQLAFHGVGGVITADQIGPFSIINAKAAYSYHLPVGKDLILSLGAFAGIRQYQLDPNKLAFDEGLSQDPTFSAAQTFTAPDLSLGLWGYASNYYFGLASFQLLQSDLQLQTTIDNTGGDSGSLAMHHWATAGYLIKLNEDFMIIPSFVVKAVQPAPLSFDLNAKFRYKDLAWLGFSYRRLDSFVGIIGVTAKKKFDIAYAFDFTTSDLSNYTTGSHEILVGQRLPNSEHDPAPSQFW